MKIKLDYNTQSRRADSSTREGYLKLSRVCLSIKVDNTFNVGP